jgi:ketosteroid isomerase-like protein
MVYLRIRQGGNMTGVLRTVALAFAISTAVSRAETTVDTDREAVANASRAFLTAFNERNIPAYAAALDDSYLSTDDEGTLQTKDRVVAFATSRKREFVQRTDRGDEQVRLDGDVAVVSYLFTDVHKWGAMTTRFLLRRTEIFRKRGGRWLMIAAHTSRLPRNHFQVLETAPRVLSEYVGVYEWPRLEASDRDHFTVENGHLMSEWRGEKREYLRMGADTFFAREDSGWLTFEREPGGRVTGYTYYYPDGQPIPVKRIP